ncbi:MAG: hypothetical protein WDA59_10730 [Methanofastidiosum sp.]|jgi:hypothetical protein
MTAPKNKYTYEFVKSYIEDELGYELLSKEYVNCKDQTEVEDNLEKEDTEDNTIYPNDIVLYFA